jgi:O-antigen/teichoic acid export membrane protein
VFQILAIGFLLNSLAYVSYHAIQAVERPDVVGKYHLVVLPVYLGLSFALVYRWGIAGAAAAASLRFGLDALLLFYVAERHCGCSMRFMRRSNTLQIVLLGTILAIVSLAVRLTLTNLWICLSLGLLGVATYFLLAWRFLLTSQERPVLARALGFSRNLKLV